MLAAHYDSKKTPTGFLGATDSALPVALLLDMALTLDEKLQDRQVGFCLLTGKGLLIDVLSWDLAYLHPMHGTSFYRTLCCTAQPLLVLVYPSVTNVH